jgi:hypothetical protein
LIGSGGAVHNLYRNNWHQVIMYRDHLAQERPPEQWAIDFGEAFSDVVTNNTGPALRRGLARLMQHPQYRDAVSTRLAEMINKMLTTLSHSQQGTDDHFMSALFAAGAAGSPEDSGKKNYAGAECWELLNMRNVSTHTHTQTRHQKNLWLMPYILISHSQSQFQFGDWPNAPHVTPIRTGTQVVHSI